MELMPLAFDGIDKLVDRRWMPAEPLCNPADRQAGILHPEKHFALVEAKLTIAL